MSSKMAAIQQQLEKAGAATKTPPKVVPLAAEPPVGKPAKAPSRAGMVHIGAYMHPDFKSSLRMVQAQTGKDIQTLLGDALNDLFRAKNVPVVGGN